MKRKHSMKRLLSAVLAGVTLCAAVMTSGSLDNTAYAAKISASSLSVESGDTMAYIYAADTGHALTFRTHWVDNDEKQSVYCTQRSKSFNDDGDYSSSNWSASSLFSEMAYALYHGCSYYGEKSDSAYTTGSWKKDYYATQVVIWCIRDDYGYDGVSVDDLSSISGYEDVYEAAIALYNAVKANAGSDGYGDEVSLEIEEPDSTEMYLNSSKTYYRTGWYSLNVTGTLSSTTLSLEDAPDGAEIVYEDEDDPESRFYIRIPVEEAEQMTSDTTTFTVKATGKFKRPIAYNYYSDDSDDQNVTFLQLLVDSDSLSDTTSAVLTLEKAAIEIYKTDSESGNGVAGATYGVYADEDCTDLVATLGPTDASGCVNTASSRNAHIDNTNANDAAVTAYEDGNYVVDESLLDSSAGIWFGLTEDGRMTEADDSVMIIDTVSYSGLTSGETYTLYGKLMDQETGAALLDAEGNEITAQTTFTASSTSGSVTVEFAFDATGLEGTTTVVFEILYDSDGEWAASHEDLEDDGQTVQLVSPSAADTTTETTSSSSAVKTGDTNRPVRWIAAAVIAAGAACGWIAIKRRRKKKRKK